MHPSKKLNIAIICHPTQGGSGIVATELGMALARRGHQIDFISHHHPFRLTKSHDNIAFQEVDVTNYPLFKYPPYTITLAGKLVALCKRKKIDVLHVHYAIPHAISAYLCHQVLDGAAPPILTTLHGTDVTLLGIDQAFHEITGFAIDNSDAVTVVSEFLEKSTRESFNIHKDIRVIPNFINPEKLTPTLRNEELRSRFARDDEILVGHMSNFRAVKRIPDVLHSFHILQKDVPARLLMIGTGAMLRSARNMTRELGISKRVHFVGSVEQVGELLAQLDLFLLPSETESFGLSALEAMASGVPVIATRTGGLPEVVEDGVSGLLFDVGDYVSMARGAIELANDAARLNAMRRAARTRAVDTYPEDRIVDMYEALYWELAS